MFGYISEATVWIWSLSLLHSSGKIYKQKIFIVSLMKSIFFSLFKFSNWLSSGWVSVHLKLGGDINQQKPRSVCVANAVITLRHRRSSETTGTVWRSCRHSSGEGPLELPCSAAGLGCPCSSPVLTQQCSLGLFPGSGVEYGWQFFNFYF